ncbi:hypothetical protein KAI68_00935 [bacterium]|nr:hypothetical protein [bacterium]
MKKGIIEGYFKTIKNTLCLYLITGFLFFCVWGCSKKEEKSVTALPINITQKKVLIDMSKNLKKDKHVVKYEYKGGRYRNPLMSLTVKGMTTEGIAEMTGASLATLTLRGIIKEQRKRLALIDDISGASYIVKDKKLINQQGKRVKGVVAIVKEKSVVLITSDKGIKELKLENVLE